MKTIYVDCSYLAEHPELNTGIQRVVRHVLENLQAMTAEEPIRVQPVHIGNHRFDLLPMEALFPPPDSDGESTKPPPLPTLLQRITAYMWLVFASAREFASALAGHNATVRRFLFAPKHEFGLSFIIDTFFFKLIRQVQRGMRQRFGPDPFEKIEPGDVLLLLDSTWYSNIWPSVACIKKKGASVAAVVYDLIPITHSQFCDDFLAAVFKKWFFESLEFVDRYIGISQTVQHELQSFMLKEFGNRAAEKTFDFFHLGADFEYQQANEKKVRLTIKLILELRPAYFIVSTVEPRKNHTYLLDAFEPLWEQGHDISLIIAGRIGWKVEALVKRIVKHPQYDERLFLWPDLNDQELAYCYSHSKMLLFPSIAEGFGLPIVESLSQKLPVLASDTLVHREIGKKLIDYFDLSDPSTLTEMIKNIESNGIPAALQVPEGYKWISWRESTRQLLTKILFHPK